MSTYGTTPAERKQLLLKEVVYFNVIVYFNDIVYFKIFTC